MVKTFAIKRCEYEVSLLVHMEDGTFYELPMEYAELKDLAGLTALTLRDIDRLIRSEMEEEAAALNRAEDERIRQRETDLELDYSDKGYDAF